jgi:hypothetical protein
MSDQLHQFTLCTWVRYGSNEAIDRFRSIIDENTSINATFIRLTNVNDGYIINVYIETSYVIIDRQYYQ